MINSLYEINFALGNLTQQLANSQASPQQLSRAISQLLSEVKYLDEKEKYHYYLLVAEIYATRFQNVKEAEELLEKFAKTLDSEISMNCELRRAVFMYLGKNYKEAYKRLDLGLGEVEEELKLIDNAKFFFNRVFNKSYLISESSSLKNFQAAFILSLVHQHDKEETLALKILQSYLVNYQLNPQFNNFTKLQIYKRLLQLYEVMRKNSISTISISKKAIETYKEELALLLRKYPQLLDDYSYKVRFINRVLEFIYTDKNRTSEKLVRKLLDFKLLAYYKLKKCSKQAPSKEIKMTLQNTAKLIKISKQTDLLESILNYDFIKKEYEIFRVFYDSQVYRKLAAIKFWRAISGYRGNHSLLTKEKSLSFVKQKETKFAEQQAMLVTKNMVKNLSNTSYNQQQGPVQSQLMSFNKQQQQQQQQQTSILKQPIPNQQMTSTIMKQSKPLMMKQTISEDVLNSQFQGSKMVKINASSEGHEERYFYIDPKSISTKPRLYYCASKGSKSSGDNYYSLKGLTKISRGKQTDALRRKEAAKFPEDQCFGLMFDNGKDRSFYVPDEDDYQRWIVLLQTRMLYTEANLEKMSRTVGMSRNQNGYGEISKSSPPMKKSRRVVDII